MPGLPLGVRTSSARWLFSSHFLTQRLTEWDEWSALEVGSTRDELLALWERERGGMVGANEGQTEERFIRPVLRLLGQAYTLFPEIPGAGKTPDYLFYPDNAERAAADAAGGWPRVERASAVGDAKRFDLALDHARPRAIPSPRSGTTFCSRAGHSGSSRTAASGASTLAMTV